MDQPAEPTGEYVVVARRYRPRQFDQLIGQQHVAQALANAIQSHRVGHAYLFTGARGTGKTSAARIFAKALDCVHGPTTTPCDECDICQSIAAGSDVDVLEIDGASNRGIDEIRLLRQNVGVRPSRARFKIYIIDEVHMLTKDAFNALLKTLEEPPEHVKFIFCTTEANKIPITILSRCQRFDFAGIRLASIAERLQQIVTTEGVTADSAALTLVARRANGSMRDSQSLLEQLLASGPKHLTVAEVHALLGTSSEARLLQLLRALNQQQPGAALAELDQALADGGEPGQLLEQLLGYFRDAMVCAAGCSSETLIHVSQEDAAELKSMAEQWGLETILGIMQIIEQALARLRFNPQARTLAEMAIVRISTLENLIAIPTLLNQVRQGEGTLAGPTSSPAREVPKKKAELTHEPTANDPVPSLPQPLAQAAPAPSPPEFDGPLTTSTVGRLWQLALSRLGPDLLAENLACASKVELSSRAEESAQENQLARSAQFTANAAPKTLAISFPARYNFARTYCERPEQLARIARVLSETSGRSFRLEFLVDASAPIATPAAPVERPMPSRDLLAEKGEHPLVKRAAELFGATAVHAEGPPTENRAKE